MLQAQGMSPTGLLYCRHKRKARHADLCNATHCFATLLEDGCPQPALYGQHVPQACGEQHVTEGMDDEKASVMSCPPGAQGEGAPAVTEIPPVASQRCIRISCKARRT